MIFVTILFVIVFIWLAWMTYFLLGIKKNYLTLTQGINRKSLDVVLTNLLMEVKTSKKDIANLVDRCDRIEKEERFHIQKIGLLRFNPFKDTGGDQSFILALVDSYDTGVIITALYSRTGTRWYTKRVVKGKGMEHELSDEEKKALKMTQGVQ
jgi:hypothetical protein